jgi:LPS-assembly lipoprotein
LRDVSRQTYPAALGRFLVLGFTLLMLNACGFHLRGDATLPEAMAVTYIQAKNPFDTLNEDFRDALEGHGARVTENRDEATAILRILSNRDEKDVLTVDIGGKVQEILIRQTIRFDVVAPDNQPLVEKQTVTLSRDFVFNKDDILAKEREADLISNELQRDVVNMAMLRIAAASRNLQVVE